MAASVEYPKDLPAPLNGSTITPAERRFASKISGRRNYRTVQRDYLGAMDIAFTFTPEQSEKFRFWWLNWLARGAGFFAADWPLLQSRTGNVFRFVAPPEWTLIGGRLDGQGYWRVSATVEIRGRGMLPELPIWSVSSRPYPLDFNDELQAEFTNLNRLPAPNFRDSALSAFSGLSASYASVGYRDYTMFPDTSTAVFSGLSASYSTVIYSTYTMAPETAVAAFSMLSASGAHVLITYSNYLPEAATAAFSKLTSTWTRV